MNNIQISSKAKKVVAILAIGFLAYNVAVFSIFGFSGHHAAFWISYVFMLLSFATMVVSGYFVNNKQMQPKDNLLGYPVMKHCVSYLIFELIISVAFMIWDNYNEDIASVAIAVQVIVAAAFIALIISAFLAKEKIEEVDLKVKEKTSFMKLLKVDAEMVAEKTDDPDIKKAFSELAEKIRYSDPMSNPALEYIENQIADLINESTVCITMGEKENALENCKKAMLLLVERNKKCQVLK